MMNLHGSLNYPSLLLYGEGSAKAQADYEKCVDESVKSHFFSLFSLSSPHPSSCDTNYACESTNHSTHINRGNSSHEKCDQSVAECETVPLDDSKKFKIININQETANLDGHENKFELKTQLIEIDKLLINNNHCHQNGQNGAANKSETPSRFGVWHQVSVGAQCAAICGTMCDLEPNVECMW